MRIEKLNNVESALVDVEMDVAFLEIRRGRFPYSRVGILGFNRLPGGRSDALPVHFRRDEKEFQRIVLRLAVDLDDGAAHAAAV